MVEAGLYTPGTDADMDRAVKIAPLLEDFIASVEPSSTRDSFRRLSEILAMG